MKLNHASFWLIKRPMYSEEAFIYKHIITKLLHTQPKAKQIQSLHSVCYYWIVTSNRHFSKHLRGGHHSLQPQPPSDQKTESHKHFQRYFLALDHCGDMFKCAQTIEAISIEISVFIRVCTEEKTVFYCSFLLGFRPNMLYINLFVYCWQVIFIYNLLPTLDLIVRA